jgi:hypothetical protein
MVSRLTQVVAGAALTLAILPGTAQAASLDLDSWIRIGDVKTTSSQAKLTNAVKINSGLGSDDIEIVNGVINEIERNISRENPLDVFSGAFESAIVLPQGAVGIDAKEGSAILQFLTVLPGDKFSFNWNLEKFGTGNVDRAFVAINNVINPKANNTAINLTGNSLFSRTFTEAGTYRVAIGVVDAGVDYTDSSILTVSSADVTPVPTPALLPGLIALGMRVRAKRRTAAA